MYSISYSKYGLPEVNLSFKTETSMWNYVSAWINGDEDSISYYRDGVKYNPPWAV